MKIDRKMTSLILFFSLFGTFLHPFETECAEREGLRFGIAAMISPKKTLTTYRQILIYLSDKLGMPVEMVQRKTYAEMDELLKTKNVMIAMLCSGPYVADHDDFGAELLVAAEMYGKPYYHSYFIVPKDSPVNNLEGLRGKNFALTDPKSNTGCIVPTYMLSKRGESVNSFFSSSQYSGHHSKSIEMVAKKEVDGAAIDHLIWEYLNNTSPVLTSRTKVINKSPAYGMPPIAVHPDMDPRLKTKIKDIFLNMHFDKDGKRILSKIFIDRFIVPEEKNYDTVREMIKFLEESKKKEGSK
jgi:phosphonate transport system substrate-binding protein